MSTTTLHWVVAVEPHRELLPVACTLGPDDGADRMERWRALSAAGKPTVHRDGPRMEVRYEATDHVQAELEALVLAESQCCSFVRWSVSEHLGHPTLVVAADPGNPGALDAIAFLFGAERQTEE